MVWLGFIAGLTGDKDMFVAAIWGETLFSFLVWFESWSYSVNMDISKLRSSRSYGLDQGVTSSLSFSGLFFSIIVNYDFGFPNGPPTFIFITP